MSAMNPVARIEQFSTSRGSHHFLVRILFLLVLTLVIIFLPQNGYSDQATLTWTPPTTNANGTALTDLAGYIVYYGTASGNYSQNINVGDVTTYTVSNLTAGTTYYFAVTAYDTAGNQSAYSNQVSETTPQQYTLTTSKLGSGSGTVTSSPSGINCGTSCAAAYTQSTIVTLTASPATGSTLTGWSGGGCAGTGTCSLTLNANTTVTATFAINTYTVTPAAGANGSISPSSAQTVNYNGTEVFTVTPSSGYSIASVTGCGGTLSGSSYTTGAITANCTVTASFSQNTYTVTPAAGANGSISPATAQTVNYNGTEVFTVTPSSGYSIASVTGCGGTLSGSTYTTGVVTANCTVTASFAMNTYTVTPSAAVNGSISPSTAQTVNYNGTEVFTVTPGSGYSIASVTGCGGTLSG
ncbi:MAG: fibronectin type III domain-containing protein, partial [Thermodesulfovibrionales bacterium]